VVRRSHIPRRESERIFARAWQYVGHTGQVAESGAFFATAAGQIPVVVTRARDGLLRAFLNVCRFFAPDVDQAWVDELIAFDDQIGREDTALVEGGQRGVRSGVLTEGRLLSESEQLVAHFQALTRQALERSRLG
jgi:phenylpropionate dioxygenase-like ring-hydroxylating dioxygenase large terminal subunit